MVQLSAKASGMKVKRTDESCGANRGRQAKNISGVFHSQGEAAQGAHILSSRCLSIDSISFGQRL